MDAQRWQRVGAIFDEVAEAEPSLRAALLLRLCAGDVSLQREVEMLLAADAQAGRFERGVDSARRSSALEWVDRGDASPSADERVGPWRVLREIGRGGMGIVLLAERADGQFEQRAALKLVKRGMDSDAVLARFLRERQILALLEHRHIARLLDGGRADDGRPYFAMEYVDGVALPRYCAERNLALDERIALFLDVCAAVQFAHGRLVVHRDIKPSNVLVADDGNVKLLDFGIAKLLMPDADAFATATAAERERPFTLAYAAPEQLRGEPVTVATDVYGLGCLLYEVLAGTRPFASYDLATPEQAALVLETTSPPPPSKVIGADATLPARRLRGDLDTIVLKALQRDPQRRYETVDALAADLRRFVARRPIAARRDSRLYRARKFVARHWIGVGATLGVAALLIAATAVSVQQAQLARRQAARAQTVTAFLTDMFRFADPKGAPGGVKLTAKEMLDAGARRLDQQLQGEPALAARFSATVGAIYTQLGEYDRAIALLEHAVAQPGVEPADRANALADLARAHYEKGDYAAAQKDLDQALALHTGIAGAQSALVASDLALDGEIARRQGDFARAETLLKQALAQSRVALAAPHAQIAAQLNQLATLYADMRRVGDAREPTEQALAMFRALYGENHLDVAENLANLGVIMMQTDKVTDALPLFERAEAIYRTLLPGDHPLLAVALANQARALDRLGRFSESQAKYLQALAMQRKLLGEDHPDVAATLNNLSVLDAEQGDYRAAADLCRRVLAIWQALGKPQHPMALATRVHLAAAQRELGEVDAAVQALRETVDTARTQLGERHPITLLAQVELAIALREAGHVDDALQLQRSIQPAFESATGLPPQLAANAQAQLALTQLAAGDAAAARKQVDAARAVFASMKTLDAVSLGDVLQAQAKIALAQGDVEAGCAAAEQALTLAQEKFGDDSMRAARAHLAHADCARTRGRSADAQAEASAARRKLREVLGAQAPAAR